MKQICASLMLTVRFPVLFVWWISLECVLSLRTSGLSFTAKSFSQRRSLGDGLLGDGNVQQLRPKKVYRDNLSEEGRLKKAFDELQVPSFEDVARRSGAMIQRMDTTILQLNIGLLCNQACSHCHVESSPLRTEMMSMEVATKCINILDHSPSIDTLDLTGGAPELNECFRFLVKEGRKRKLRVIDRCNLTVLLEKGQEDLGEFLRDNEVNVVASLPCYSEENVNKQRGGGVFGRSILALQYLNSLGYGMPGSNLKLDLVYNPSGPFLPPPQLTLQEQYKEKLRADFGIEFNALYTITNMPIKRFADYLIDEGKLASYMELLVTSFNPGAASGVMCTNTLSVMWDGSIYDCDFNQQLGLGVRHSLSDSGSGADGSSSESNSQNEVNSRGTKEGSVQPSAAGTATGLSVFDLNSTMDLRSSNIEFRRHCFGCTAGAGSSCQGATSA